jgi:precorrin-4/cobalt-precorrin-4 C11-methyltransferase
MSKVYFIGAGPGDPDLLTIKARDIISSADIIVYAGSLVNPKILDFAKPGAIKHNSAKMELVPMVELMATYAKMNRVVARVHTGDPSIYGAIAEQMNELDKLGIEYEIVPGVSSAFAAAAALQTELTMPEVSQTVIFTRMEGKTPVPDRQTIGALAQHGATMAIFLSVGDIENVVEELLTGYPERTPAAVVYKASWPEEKVITGTLVGIADKVRAEGIDKTALIFVGDALDRSRMKAYSKLYDKGFRHGYRK